MEQPSIRRAILSWILLFLIAAGIGWLTYGNDGMLDAVTPPAGASPSLGAQAELPSAAPGPAPAERAPEVTAAQR